MQRHPYQQIGDEWRLPSPSRNMGCCSTDIYHAMLLLGLMESINPEDFERVDVGSGLLTPRELIASMSGRLAGHFDRMAEDCNNAGVTSADYAEWSKTARSVTSAQDAKDKAREVMVDMGNKLRPSARQGNCR